MITNHTVFTTHNPFADLIACTHALLEQMKDRDAPIACAYCGKLGKRSTNHRRVFCDRLCKGRFYRARFEKERREQSAHRS